MDLNYSTEELAFRDEVRGWLAANLPQDLRSKVADGEHFSKEELLRWHKILAKKGWVAPAWPQEWGGPGWNMTQRYIFEEECAAAGAPPARRALISADSGLGLESVPRREAPDRAIRLISGEARARRTAA